MLSAMDANANRVQIWVVCPRPPRIPNTRTAAAAVGRLHKGGSGAEPHLGHGRVDLQDLLMTVDLANADFARELGGGGAVSLQGEGTVQGLLVAAPHLGERELLTGQKKRPAHCH